MEKAVAKVVSKTEKQGSNYVRVLEITDMIDGSVVKTKSKSHAGRNKINKRGAMK